MTSPFSYLVGSAFHPVLGAHVSQERPIRSNCGELFAEYVSCAFCTFQLSRISSLSHRAIRGIQQEPRAREHKSVSDEVRGRRAHQAARARSRAVAV